MKQLTNKQIDAYVNAVFCREVAGIETPTIEDLKQAYQDGFEERDKMTEEKTKKYTGYGYHGGGRKAKGSEPRTCTMSIVCTESDKAKIKADAAKYGLSVSEYCTKKLLDIL